MTDLIQRAREMAAEFADPDCGDPLNTASDMILILAAKLERLDAHHTKVCDDRQTIVEQRNDLRDEVASLRSALTAIVSREWPNGRLVEFARLALEGKAERTAIQADPTEWLSKLLDASHEERDRLLGEIEAAREREAKLMAVLQWYAAEESWVQSMAFGGARLLLPTPALEDRGQRARAALGEGEA